MFARLEKVPSFELVSVGLGPAAGDFLSENRGSDKRRQQLWRKYKLSIPDFECDILEVFPSRQMFIDGTRWLDNKPWEHVTFEPSVKEIYVSAAAPEVPTSLILFSALAFFLMISFQVSIHFTRASLVS